MTASPGQTHAILLVAIREGLLEQFGDAFVEADDAHLVIPSGCTPQTAYVKVDVSWLTDVALAALGHATASPAEPSVTGPGKPTNPSEVKP
jgi:hypothetical protein